MHQTLFTVNYEAGASIRDSQMWHINTPDLSVSPHDGTEKLPRTAAPVDAYHPQNLEKAETAQRRRGKNLTTGAETQDDNAGGYHNDICTQLLYCCTSHAFNQWRIYNVEVWKGGDNGVHFRHRWKKNMFFMFFLIFFYVFCTFFNFVFLLSLKQKRTK